MPIIKYRVSRTPYRIYADQINTPRLITDDTNRPVWQWDAKPFGDSQPNEDLDGNGIPFHYNLRFPGQYYDAETKTHYNWNRFYNPQIGRYFTSDPIGLNGGFNSYTYAKNNSLLFTDATGLDVERSDEDSAFNPFRFAWFGTHVHNNVFTRYIEGLGLQGGNTNNGIFGTLKPDAYSISRVWELKRISYLTGYKRTQAETQINDYVRKGNENSFGGAWSKGNPFRIFDSPWITTTSFGGYDYVLNFLQTLNHHLNFLV